MIHIEGASDDIIMIGGDVEGEFNVVDETTGTLTLSDGTIIAYRFDSDDPAFEDGVWRFTVDRAVVPTATIEPPDVAAGGYSDRVSIVLDADSAWVRLDATGEKVTR